MAHVRPASGAPNVSVEVDEMGKGPCTVDGCQRQQHARQWCHLHWRRWRETGDLGPANALRERQSGACTVDGCDRDATTRGLCNKHYERRRLGRASAEVPGDARARPKVACSVAECSSLARARGLCEKHWARWRRNGDPTDTTRDYGSYRREHQNGYVLLWAPGHPAAHADGYALEHRMVVIDAGIEIPDGWHVHHLNHVKDDNRLENLVVLDPGEHGRVHFTGCNQYGHRCGQEVSDAC